LPSWKNPAASRIIVYLKALLERIQITQLFIHLPCFNDIRPSKAAVLTFVNRCHPFLPEDPHHKKGRIELEGPFFGSTNDYRSDPRRFALFDRIEQILPIFDPAWINARFLA
jgi:hypothetical protein